MILPPDPSDWLLEGVREFRKLVMGYTASEPCCNLVDSRHACRFLPIAKRHLRHSGDNSPDDVQSVVASVFGRYGERYHKLLPSFLIKALHQRCSRHRCAMRRIFERYHSIVANQKIGLAKVASLSIESSVIVRPDNLIW